MIGLPTALRLSLVALAFAAAIGRAQQPSTTEGTPLPPSVAVQPSGEPGSQLTVYLLTMGPGDQVWEKFGHNAIWIHDSLNGTDIAYHWGLFDFADKDFIPRFVQGRMRYSMGAFDMRETVEQYRRTNRTVWSQELNLDPAQRQALADFVAWNVLPANRYYHYDYYRDNCSTRVRDALDRALGGVIQSATGNVSSGTSYRFHTSRLTQDDWPVFTGTMAGLGQPVDRTISAWEEMFLPVKMMQRFRTVRVPGMTGTLPLVKSETILVQATRPAEDVTIRRGPLSYFVIALVVLLLGLSILLLRLKRGRSTGVVALGTLWSLIAGIGGLLLAGLWGFTDHLYSYRNENLFQLNPLSILLMVLLVRLFWRRARAPRDRSPEIDALTLVVAAVVALVSALGFVLQVLPSFDQVNGDIIALALPLHLGLVGALLALRNARKISPQS